MPAGPKLARLLRTATFPGDWASVGSTEVGSELSYSFLTEFASNDGYQLTYQDPLPCLTDLASGTYTANALAKMSGVSSLPFQMKVVGLRTTVTTAQGLSVTLAGRAEPGGGGGRARLGR